MDWLLSTTQAISTDVAYRKNVLAQEEQYCSSLREHIEEAEKEKENLNAEITSLLESFDYHRRRYTADSETRRRMQESACLYREKERKAEAELMEEREKRMRLQEKMEKTLRKHENKIGILKAKFPSMFRSSEDDIKCLNQLRAKKNKLKETILSLEKSVSSPENKDWSLWKQHVVRLAELMSYTNQIYYSYKMNNEDSRGNTNVATNDIVEEANELEPNAIIQKVSASLDQYKSCMPSSNCGEEADFTLFDNDAMDIEAEEPSAQSKKSSEAESDAMEIETVNSTNILEKQSNESPVANNASVKIIQGSVDDALQNENSGTGNQQSSSAVDDFGASELKKDSISVSVDNLPQFKDGPERNNVDKFAEVRTLCSNLFSSSPIAQTGLSQKLNEFSLCSTPFGSPIFHSSTSTTSKYFNQFKYSSPLQRRIGSRYDFSSTLSEMDTNDSAKPIAPNPTNPPLEEPNNDSTDFEKSFELLDIEQCSLFEGPEGPKKQRSQNDTDLPDDSGFSGDPDSSKIDNLGNLELPSIIAGKSYSTSKGTMISQTESKEDMYKSPDASTKIAGESSSEINNLKECSVAESLKPSSKPDSSEKPYGSTSLAAGENEARVIELKSTTEGFCNVPSKDERKAFVQSLFQTTPPVEYSPIFQTTPPVEYSPIFQTTPPMEYSPIFKQALPVDHSPAGKCKFATIAKSSESEKHSSALPTGMITECIREKSNEAARENSSLSMELTDHTSTDDSLQKPLSQPFSPTASPSSLEVTNSCPMPLHCAQKPTRQLPSLTHSLISSGHSSVNKDSGFSFSLFETSGPGLSPKGSGNVFSIFGSPGPSDSSNVGESTDSFSFFKSDGSGLEPSGAYNNPFSFDFGMEVAQTKSPPGVESNFFSMLSNSQPFTKENGDSQPSFKLF